MPLLNNLQPPQEEVTEEEITLITIQLLITIAFVITTAISALLAYDLLLKKQGKEPLFTNEEALNINNTIKYITFAMIIVIFFINIKTLEIDKDRGVDLTNDQTQIGISFLTLLAGAIGVWLAFRNTEQFNLSTIENPEV